MIKSILAFIKAHAVATAITATVIVLGSASIIVILPIAQEHKLTKSVEANLNMLVSSDFRVPESSKLDASSLASEEAENQTKVAKKDVKHSEPLTFKIVKYEVEGGTTIILEEGADGMPNMSEMHTEYRIVPSYDKDFSKWSREEKEAYDQCIKKIAKIAEAEYKLAVESEEKAFKQAEADIEKEIQSFSETYTFLSGSFRYNTYTKKYNGCVFEYGKPDEYKDYTKEEFRNNLYPLLLERIQNMEITCEEDKIDQQDHIDRLNTLYHLSD